jgi:hypothetical protein
MAGVVAPLVANHQIGFLRQKIGYLPLALVTPLGAN